MSHQNPIAGLLLLSSGLAAERNINTAANDAQFARNAAIDNIEQTRSGKLAVADGYAAKVREFAKRMVDDSTKLDDQLMGIASKDNFTVPDTLDANGHAAFGKLNGLSGAAFDREYIFEMVVEDKGTIAALQNEALYGRNKDLVNWATAALPVIQNDLRIAREIQE